MFKAGLHGLLSLNISLGLDLDEIQYYPVEVNWSHCIQQALRA